MTKVTWDRIRAWEKAHLPAPPRTARGATEADVAMARREFADLPDHYLESQRHCNGSTSPVFGEWTLTRLRDAVESWRRLAEWMAGPGDRAVYVAHGPVQAVYLHRRWFPFAWDGAGNHLCLDLAPAEGGSPGQVIGFVHDDNPRTVLAPSFQAWLDGVATRLETGELAWDAEQNAVLPAPKRSGPEQDAVLQAIAAVLSQRDASG